MMPGASKAGAFQKGIEHCGGIGLRAVLCLRISASKLACCGEQQTIGQ